MTLDPDRSASPRPPEFVHQILVVEDDKAIRWLMTDALAAAGFGVMQAGSGAEALELLDGSAANIDLRIGDVGTEHYLAKPFTMPELVARVKQLLKLS